MSGVAIRCRNCGAPLRVSPETIVAVCSYCGSPNWVRETARREILVARSRPYEEALRAFERYRRERGGPLSRAVLRDAQCLYVPFILADVDVSASYEGLYEAEITVYRREVRERYDEESGEYIREEEWVYDHSFTSRIEVSGDVRRVYRLNVLARRSAEARGVGRVAEHFRRAPTQLQPLSADVVRQPRTAFLAAEMSCEEAEKLAVDEARDRLRGAAEAKADSEARSEAESIALVHTGADTRAEVTRVTALRKRVTTGVSSVSLSPITMLPVWVLTYECGRSVYKVLMSGWDLSVVVAEEPVTLAARVAYSAASGLVAGAAGGLGLPLLLSSLSAGEAETAVLSLVAMLLGAAAGAGLSLMALRGVRVRYGR